MYVIPRRDTHTLRRDTHTLRRDAHTLRRDTHTLRRDTHTLRRDTQISLALEAKKVFFGLFRVEAKQHKFEAKTNRQLAKGSERNIETKRKRTENCFTNKMRKVVSIL